MQDKHDQSGRHAVGDHGMALWQCEQADDAKNNDEQVQVAEKGMDDDFLKLIHVLVQFGYRHRLLQAGGSPACAVPM